MSHALESRGAVTRISARRATVTVTPGGAALYAAAMDAVPAAHVTHLLGNLHNVSCFTVNER